ncbi:MAG: FecR domain-containing protein [bacterium]|nr:FecR domain-containing protein [bacterium]
MNPEQRLELLDGLLDGSISDAERLQIEAELIVDPQLRQEYYRRIRLDYLLEREAASLVVAPQTLERVSKSNWRVWSILFLTSAASLMMLAAWSHWKSRWKPVVTVSSAQEGVASGKLAATQVQQSARGFGLLRGQSEAVWAQGTLREGDLLPEGSLQLKAGQAHIELFSGVQLMVQGEAEFSVDSPMQVTVIKGRLRAQVPEPAQGFQIRTSAGDIVDLGTEFSIDAAEQDARVQVVDGEVEIRPHGSPRRRLTSGNVVRVASSGTVAEEREDLNLISPDQFQSMLEAQVQRHLESWQQAVADLRDDARLLAFYRMKPEQERSRVAKNLAAASSWAASDGAIVAAVPATDRWGRNGAALDFSRLGSRLRMTVPGEHRGISMLCWVKINSLDRWYNSLFLTDGHEDHEPHWQIMDDGRIFFSVKQPKDSAKASQQQHVYYSPSIWSSDLSGRWIMLAITYDVDQQRVTHFLDGQPISREAISDRALVENIRMGAASLGNWSEPMYRTDAEFVVRNLNGSIDEFAIFSGALSPQEIERLYRIGTPNAWQENDPRQ